MKRIIKQRKLGKIQTNVGMRAHFSKCNSHVCFGFIKEEEKEKKRSLKLYFF